MEEALKFGRTRKERCDKARHAAAGIQFDLELVSSAQVERSKWEKYLVKRAEISKLYIETVLGLHVINNAFWDMNFGVWGGGIYRATFDDYMHRFELGV
eukprot:12606105-Ditylum_brightwellii.AAC.1